MPNYKYRIDRNRINPEKECIFSGDNIEIQAGAFYDETLVLIALVVCYKDFRMPETYLVTYGYDVMFEVPSEGDIYQVPEPYNLIEHLYNQKLLNNSEKIGLMFTGLAQYSHTSLE